MVLLSVLMTCTLTLNIGLGLMCACMYIYYFLVVSMLWSFSLGVAGLATGLGYRPARIVLCRMDVFFLPPVALQQTVYILWAWSPFLMQKFLQFLCQIIVCLTVFQNDFAMLGTVKPSWHFWKTSALSGLLSRNVQKCKPKNVVLFLILWQRAPIPNSVATSEACGVKAASMSEPSHMRKTETSSKGYPVLTGREEKILEMR